MEDLIEAAKFAETNFKLGFPEFKTAREILDKKVTPRILTLTFTVTLAFTLTLTFTVTLTLFEKEAPEAASRGASWGDESLYEAQTLDFLFYPMVKGGGINALVGYASPVTGSGVESAMQEAPKSQACTQP